MNNRPRGNSSRRRADAVGFVAPVRNIAAANGRAYSTFPFFLMPKGTNFTAPLAPADIAAARAALQALHAKLAFVPQQPGNLLTSATISPERLPLADLVLKAADQAPDVMRHAFDPERLRAKVASYRSLDELLSLVNAEVKRLENALNVLGSDIRFDVDNVHEDIEKDNGETQDLGQLRRDIMAYYAHASSKGDNTPPKP